MFIERLTLKNFKSFGGVHELPFSSGFTAIVGPNGSGKSNLLDGLRWVLGESSSSRLRITRQTDLMFQGSAGVDEAEETEVELDVRDGMDTGHLRRFLNASGSTVYIDGERTRLQDLSGFKQKWRMEGDRSAFIGQGEVGAAILQKPFQRRLQLEELFGIDLYRKRRDDALDDLKSANGELMRLKTLMSELQARRDEIAPLLDDARKIRDYSERLEVGRRDLYHARRFEESAGIAELKEKIARLASRIESAKFWSEAWNTSLERLRSRGGEYAEKRTALTAELHKLKPVCDEIVDREMQLAAQRSECSFLVKRTGEDKKAAEEKLRLEEEKRSSLAGEAGALTQEQMTLSAQVNDRLDRLDKHGRELQDRKKQRADLLALEARKTEDAAQMKLRAETISSKGEERERLLAELRKIRNSLITEQTSADCELEKREDAVITLENSLKEVSGRIQENTLRSQALRRSLSKNSAELENLSARAQEGLYPRAVQVVTSAVQLGRLKINVIPAVEAFSCPAELASCLEAYLGGRQYWLLTDNDAEVKEGIALLKEKRAGRATFLSLTRAHVRASSAAPQDKNILGWAIDLVIPEEHWLPAVSHLLGGVLVVRDYDTANRLSKTARYPIVTLEGEVFSPSGTVSGGRGAKRLGAITIKNMIHETKIRIETDSEAREKLKEKISQDEAEEQKLASSLEEARSSVAIQKNVSERISERLRKESSELDTLMQEEMTSAERIRECLARAEQAGKEAAEARKKADVIEIEADVDDEMRVLTELKARLTVITERLNSRRGELAENIRNTSLLRTETAALTDKLKRSLEDESRLSAEAAALTAERLKRESEKKNIENALAALDSENALAARSMERRLLRAQKSKSGYETIVREHMIAEHQLEASRERLTCLIEDNEEQYPYPETYTPGEASAERLENSCRYLERQLRELGDVNTGVLSEDESLAKRLEYMGTQVEDVNGGIVKLKKMIADTDRQAGKIFGNALGRIDTRFNDLFRRLFGGGEAHLKAEEDKTLWEAGVEIIARPPGKKTLFLAQLSGGEQSLTALSLLFASMEVARVPLAVLDEVDAALDEANLTRFAKMVADYSQNIQVIAMTHRRQTMEQAQVMYGVTMSEPGLSQIVGVKPDQWQ